MSNESQTPGRQPLERTLENESMDVPEEAQQYEEMDHSSVNRVFVDDLLAGGHVGQHVIDMGCGPAAIPIELCQRDEEVLVIALDSSIAMLEIAKVQIDFAGMLDRIFLEQGDVKDIEEFQESSADTVISNTMMHHLPDPTLAIEAALYLRRDGGRIFIRDLARPESESEVERLVQTYAQGETDFAQQQLRQSLHAALTCAEMKEMVQAFGISPDHVQMTSDRHWTIDWTAECTGP